ncbi:hypothetical protein E3N88_38686 [Mikania micrantha]|uniref:Uncharacterized protein n=1 Tax=Mikania micrantha TaxID=192012 RepID=A0A5N6LUR1_9ASTR|nr:hypothetical protein E3N88_38686 [Mikania micrantha]
MVQRTIRRLCRRVAPGTVEAVICPVAHALTQPTTGPNHRADRAVSRCVSPRRPDDDSHGPSRRTGPKTRRTGRQYGATTPRAARSGAPHGLSHEKYLRCKHFRFIRCDDNQV